MIECEAFFLLQQIGKNAFRDSPLHKQESNRGASHQLSGMFSTLFSTLSHDESAWQRNRNAAWCNNGVLLQKQRKGLR